MKYNVRPCNAYPAQKLVRFRISPKCGNVPVHTFASTAYNEYLIYSNHFSWSVQLPFLCHVQIMTEERPRRGAGVNSLLGRRHGPLGSSYGLCPPLFSDLPQLDALRVHGHASDHHALVAAAARCHTSSAHELDGLLDIASSARPGPYVSLSSTLDVACPMDAVQNREQAPALASTGVDSSSSRDSSGKIGRAHV